MDEHIESSLSKIRESVDSLPQGYYVSLDSILSSIVADMDSILWNASNLHPRFDRPLVILENKLD